MPVSKRTIGDKLLRMSTVLKTLKEDVLLRTSLEKYKYDEAKINAMTVLYNEVLAAIEKQNSAISQKKETTRLRDDAYRLAFNKFSDNWLIARRAFKGITGLYNELGISRKPKTNEGWYNNARAFYTTALANTSIQEKLSVFGIKKENLDEGLFLVNNYEQLYTEQKNKKGLAQVAIIDRDKKLMELNDCFLDFINICRVAFRENPQQLERFGIIQYSRGYSPKKKETPALPSAKKTEYNTDNPAAE